MPCKIAIIGGGVNGLATGLQLLHDIPRSSVHIIAELLGDATTSRGAGGLWKPFSLGEQCLHTLVCTNPQTVQQACPVSGDTPSTDVIKWGQSTFQHMLELFQSPAASAAGMQLVDAYQLWEVKSRCCTNSHMVHLGSCLCNSQEELCVCAKLSVRP